MTYTESAALMTNLDFRGRIKVAVLKFATYITEEPPSVPGHNTRVKWAFNALIAPDAVAQQVQSPVVWDAAVQEAGADIPDDALQTAVENTLNKLL